MKDFIDVERLARQGSSHLEQDAFILSRYFGKTVGEILALDARMINIMMEEVNTYVNTAHDEYDRGMLKKEFEKQINLNEEIDNRFEILDL